MRARIYKPARNAMTSGQARTKNWVLEQVAGEARAIDPLMGWTSSADTRAQVRIPFASKEAALAFAKENGIDAVVTDPNRRAVNIRSGGYGENFSPNRRGTWTH